ncbi:MAG: aspartate carbamoyltransferase catalytic subunit [Vulcanimicrobiaceae bacterium]
MRTRRSLVDLSDLSGDELEIIFTRAQRFEEHPPGPLLAGVACVNLFFEASTRTFVSFNLAELRLGAHVVNLSPKDASLATKGETIEDTAMTLGAMGVAVFVLRHPESGYAGKVALAFDGHVINAGDGMHAHPTQALLDLFTLREEFGTLLSRTVAIVGDVAHSRVAHSSMLGLRRLGADVVLVGPPEFVSEADAPPGVTIERDLDKIAPHLDAVILLRIQRERIGAMPFSEEEYVARYRLDAQRCAALPAHVVVLHPGPYNRGIELDESVLSFAGWRYARQVMHGVSVRMAVLDLLVNGPADAAC